MRQHFRAENRVCRTTTDRGRRGRSESASLLYDFRIGGEHPGKGHMTIGAGSRRDAALSPNLGGSLEGSTGGGKPHSYIPYISPSSNQ